MNKFFSFIPFCIVMLLTAAALAQPFHIPIETSEQNRIFSEFNHHLIGFFLILIGVMAFLGAAFPEMRLAARLWPLLFILSGIYLALMSDPDVWPMGRMGWFDAFLHNPEAGQHKIYAALLVAIGFLELQRARGRLGPFLAAWGFPILAVFGAVLLFFHPHGSAAHAGGHAMHGMRHGAGMTESMRKIQQEHLVFSLVGFCIVVSKFFFDSGRWKSRAAPFLWPALMSALGVLLFLYSE